MHMPDFSRCSDASMNHYIISPMYYKLIINALRDDGHSSAIGP